MYASCSTLYQLVCLLTQSMKVAIISHMLVAHSPLCDKWPRWHRRQGKVGRMLYFQYPL